MSNNVSNKMKIAFKTLDQRTFHVEFDIMRTVGELKNHLAGMKDVSLPADNVQLIYAGRIMKNEDKLNSYNIESNKFLVVMAKKTILSKPEQGDAKAPQQRTNISSAQQTVQPTTAPDDGAHIGDTPTPLPSVVPDENRVQELVSMGYEEADVRAALSASFNHPERAIEYLISGIPTHAQPEIAMPTPAPPPSPVEGIAVGTPRPTTPTPIALEALIGNPNFERLCSMVRSRPELLSVLLERLHESNPEMFDTISNNQEEFLELLTSQTGETETGENEAGNGIGDIQLSDDDNNAVDRLTDLGFERDLALQVYMACNRNEELAADFLFRQFEDEDDP